MSPYRRRRPRPAPRVLVVDDDRTLAGTVAAILGDAAEVATAATGEEAIEEVRRHPRGVALIDVILPDIGGMDLMRRIREVAPDVAVAILTGNATLHGAIDALNHGARRYILKPCDPDELQAIVRDLIERQELEQRSRLYLRRLEVQNGLSEALSAALTPEDVARAAAEAVSALGEVRTVVVLAGGDSAGVGVPGGLGIPTGAGPTLRPLASVGMDDDTVAALAAMPEVRDLATGGTSDVPHMAVIPGGPALGTGVPALALCRLRGRTSVLGVLAAAVSGETAMDEHHWDLLIAISNWVGLALERATLYRRLEVAYQEVKNGERRVVQAEKLSAVGRLAAGLAHEVGTPLNIISGRAEYLLRDAAGSPKLEQGLKVIVQQIERISRLIGQVLDFSREYGPVRSPVDLSGVLAAISPLLDTRLGKADTDLEVFLQPRLPRVAANFNQMQQVFLNLLMNSIDAIQADPEMARTKGRGRVTIQAEPVPRARKVRVTVEDNGQGIREEHLDKVFDPFFSTKAVGSGTGLGLAVVYGIVTEHGGTIEVESRWGIGTAVHFTLPMEGV
ncbi:MAG: response regulator [Deltaproteobacteria bacterium]|nr:response regulator [Deltaproteobacteria bacterium]